MPWFRVDDSFYDHPKAIAAGPALALWLRAGCHCARYLTDGFVSSATLRALGGTAQMAKRLVDAKARPGGAGLWVVVEGGWQFHDWSDYQPSKADVEEKRRKRAEAGRLGGIKSGQSRGARGADGNEASSEAFASHTFEPPARPGPARTHNPLLTLAGRLGEVDAHDLTASLPADVLDAWQAAAGPGVDLEHEARAYLARHGDTSPRNPRGAWLGWLRKAAERAERHAPTAPPRPACRTPGCVGGWLPDTTDGRAVPCPTCKPSRHLQPVPHVEAS